MSHHLRRHFAIDAGLLLAAFCVATAAAATPAGTVTRSSGLLFAQSAEGRAKVLAEGSAVAAGDRLVSGKDTYAQVTFADAGVVVLGPETELAIDAFSFDRARPADDRAELTLIRGALRVASGAIAKRSPNRQALTTPLGSLAGGAATFIVSYTPGDAAAVAMGAPVRLAALSSALSGTLSDAPPIQIAQLTLPSPPKTGGLAPGLYVSVIDGVINLSNKGGTQNFSAGQFGYTASMVQPPIVVPANPSLRFTPPPAFSAPPSSSSSSSAGRAAAVDCEVR